MCVCQSDEGFSGMDLLLKTYSLSDDDCSVEITKCHLQEISSSLCEDWRSLPAHLEMESIVASDIERKQVEECEKRHSFLSKWKCEKGSAATYKKLMAALLAIKCKGDAEKVCVMVQKLSQANGQQDLTMSEAKSEPNEANTNAESSKVNNTGVSSVYIGKYLDDR